MESEFENLFDLNNIRNLTIKPLGKKDEHTKFVDKIPDWDDIVQLRIVVRCMFCNSILGVEIVNDAKECTEFMRESLMNLRCHMDNHNFPKPFPNIFVFLEYCRINQVDSFSFHN